MGREIRRVPADWEHPKSERYPDRYESLYDNDYETACQEWWAEALLWADGKHEVQQGKHMSTIKWFWEWSNPPDSESYRERKWTPEEATHYQVYETVSEGTPVSPAFATEDELIDYLVENGDFWCQGRPDESPPSRKAATAFVKGGWAPSFVAVGGKLKSGVDAAGDL